MRLVRHPDDGVVVDGEDRVAPPAIAAAVGHVGVEREIVPAGRNASQSDSGPDARRSGRVAAAERNAKPSPAIADCSETAGASLASPMGLF